MIVIVSGGQQIKRFSLLEIEKILEVSGQVKLQI